MKNVVIVGAGGFGRELACWLQDFLATKKMRIAGFLDDNLEVGLINENYPYPVLGTIATYTPAVEDLFVLAIGNPAAKLRIAAQLEQRGGEFLSLVHPTVIIASTAKLGKGVVICPFSLVSADSKISDFVTINAYSSVGHDAVVGEGTTISAHVDITGYVQVGSGVFIGSGASILPKVKIGDRAIVGAGSIVVRRVLEGTTVYALPAKKL